jgi:Tfp pilus assembly PilM family ATPase
MHSEVVALIKAMTSIGPQGDNSASLYLDIGAGVTKVAIAQGPRLVFARTIDLGGRHLDHAIARQTRTDIVEARQIRLNLRDLSAAAAGAAAGGGSAATAVAEDYTFRQAVRAVTEPLEILTDEVAMCLRYYESLFPGTRPARVTFLGGEARHVPLCTHIARALKMPALSGDPMAGVARTGREPSRGVDFTGSQPGWAMVLGLALCPTDL